MNRRLATAFLALATVTTSAHAQKHRSSSWLENADGAETCRDIWDKYGSYGNSDADAVYCEIRNVGSLNQKSLRAEAGENGGVMVRGEARSDVMVQLVIQAQARTVDDARRLAKDVSIDLSARTLHPENVGSFGRGRRVAAVVVLTTPRNIDLSLSARNGPLSVARVNGALDLETVNGPLDLSDIGGDVHARTTNGPLSIHLTGTRWDGAGLDASAQNGPLSLAIPRNYSAELETGTSNGPMDTDYPITVTRFDGKRIRTTLGSGGPRIRATTENGPMSLHMSR